MEQDRNSKRFSSTAINCGYALFNGSPSVRFHNVDCMEFMKTIPDKFYDLAIVDPPYGIKEKSNRVNLAKGAAAHRKKYNQALWDQNKPQKDYFTELERVSKNQVIWGGNYFSDNLDPSRCWIVWDKVTQDSPFADVELAWTNFDKSARLFTYRWNGMLQQNMKNKEERIHQTQKPVDLYRWILKSFSDEKTKILDTHGGSMSSAIACDMEGYDLDICEIDSEYFQKGVQRFQQYKSQKRLF